MECAVETTEKSSLLTDRQMEVLALYVREGKTIKEISHHLEISMWTVRWHLYRARDYLGADSLVQMAFLAAQRGLITAGEDEP